MIRHTFNVKKTKNTESVSFTVDMPSSMDDVDAITQRFGTVERMIDRANAQWTVDAAPGIRKRLPDMIRATAYANEYTDNGRKDTYVPKVNVNHAESVGITFDEEQLKYLEARNMIAS